MTNTEKVNLENHKQRLGNLIDACRRRGIIKIGRSEYCQKIKAVHDEKDLTLIKRGILKYETLINDADTAANQSRKRVNHGA